MVDRTPDGAGRLQSTTDWIGNTIGYTYDPSNNVTKITYPTSTSESLTYSYQNELTLSSASYAGSVVGSVSESWTPNADELVSQNVVPSALTASGTGYTSNPGYDSLNRVSSATNPATTTGADTYGYAYNGELTSDLPPGTGMSAITYSYDIADELTSKVNPNTSVTSTYAYTADGQRCWSVASNIASPSCASPPSGATSYAWNAFGDLCWSGSTTSTNVCSSPPSGVTTYGYNGDGARITSTTGGTTQQYTWDNVDAQAHRSCSRTAPTLTSTGQRCSGTPLPSSRSLSSHQASYLGSTPAGVQLVFNQSGSLLNKTSYSTYGLQTNSASADTPFGFQGGYTDSSGLIYLDHRYYDPLTAQFISVDPLGNESPQPYAYTGDDPVNASDPSGLIPMCDWSPSSCGLNGDHQPVAVVNAPFSSEATSVPTGPPALQPCCSAGDRPSALPSSSTSRESGAETQAN